MTKRLHVYFSGTVQGVGFRYTVQNVATALGLLGWVRNTRDGRVEAVCEGEEKKLIAFLDKIKNGPLNRYITSTDTDWQEATSEFDDFDIRF